MKIFLDTASIKEIREGAALGVVDGVTTNPSLLAREPGDPEEILLEICRIVDGPISAEVVAIDLEGMLREGRHWASVHKNIVAHLRVSRERKRRNAACVVAICAIFVNYRRNVGRPSGRLSKTNGVCQQNNDGTSR